MSKIQVLQNPAIWLVGFAKSSNVIGRPAIQFAKSRNLIGGSAIQFAIRISFDWKVAFTKDGPVCVSLSKQIEWKRLNWIDWIYND